MIFKGHTNLTAAKAKIKIKSSEVWQKKKKKQSSAFL